MLERVTIFALVPRVRGRVRALRISARFSAFAFRLEAFSDLRVEIGGVRFVLVFDTDERSRVSRELERFSDCERDRLRAVMNLSIAERPERRTFRGVFVLV